MYTPGEAEEGREVHPIHTVSVGTGGVSLAPSPFYVLLGVAKKGEGCPYSYCHRREQGHIGAPQVTSSSVLLFPFPALGSSWEQSSGWNKGDLQLEIRPSPSGSPSQWVPSGVLAWEEGQGHL